MYKCVSVCKSVCERVCVLVCVRNCECEKECVCVYACAHHMCVYSWRVEESIRSPRAGVAGSCEPPVVSAGIELRYLGENS